MKMEFLALTLNAPPLASALGDFKKTSWKYGGFLFSLVRAKIHYMYVVCTLLFGNTYRRVDKSPLNRRNSRCKSNEVFQVACEQDRGDIGAFMETA